VISDSSLFFFYSYGDHRDLHSFPTRRSSDLVLTALGVDLEAPKGEDVLAVAGLEAQPAHAGAEEHGAKLGVLVLQREVGVAGGVETEVRDLPLDPHRRELLLDHAAKLVGELRHAQDRAFGRHRVAV